MQTSSAIRRCWLHGVEADLIDLRDGLDRTRWPDELPEVGWNYGVSLSYLNELAAYRRTTYDWRAQEGSNRFPQFTTTLDGETCTSSCTVPGAGRDAADHHARLRYPASCGIHGATDAPLSISGMFRRRFVAKLVAREQLRGLFSAELTYIKLTFIVSLMPSGAMRVFTDLAENQAGYFTVHQATQAGLSHRVLSYHVSSGDLERVAHGVYRWTPFPQHRFGDVIAAAMWVGSGAAASHETALAVYELAAAMPAAIHLTTPRQFRGRRRGVVVHHAPLSPAEIRQFDSVPVTTPARTLIDVARGSDPSLARQATSEALEQGLLTPRRLQASLTATPDADRLRAALSVDITGKRPA